MNGVATVENEDKPVTRMMGRLGGMDGESKNPEGWYRFANEKLKTAYIWKQDQLDAF